MAERSETLKNETVMTVEMEDTANMVSFVGVAPPKIDTEEVNVSKHKRIES